MGAAREKAVDAVAADPERRGWRAVPAWVGGLAFSGVLILAVTAYFFWQARQLESTYREHAAEHARMLAVVIERNARNALSSRQSLEDLMTAFLGHLARFVDYLDTVEPFRSQELTEFALENGLVGIRVTHGADITDGPPGWLPPDIAEPPPARLARDSSGTLCLLRVQRAGGDGMILMGISAAPLDRLREHFSLERLARHLTGLAGVLDIRLIPEPERSGDPAGAAGDDPASPQVTMVFRDGRNLAEVRLPTGDQWLLVTLDTHHFMVRSGHFRREFAVFVSGLLGMGVFFSWLFHHFQRRYLGRIREVERHMARQREDAALGRAAAAIAHEIRNPLNAIAIGLQRLELEAAGLSPEHRGLVTDMRAAVARTNAIVSHVRDYARPPVPDRKPTDVAALVDHLLGLYRPVIEAGNLTVRVRRDISGAVAADARLLTQALENLLKNAIEASPDGGVVEIRLFREEGAMILEMTNAGFDLPADEVGKILEPYFTTKTRGTGLGLAIAKRIMTAHGGEIRVRVPEPGAVAVGLILPLDNGGRGKDP